MPSQSLKQKYFFNILAHNPELAKKKGISPEVVKEWHEADKARSPKEEKKAFAKHARKKAREAKTS